MLVMKLKSHTFFIICGNKFSQFTALQLSKKSLRQTLFFYFSHSYRVPKIQQL